MNHNLVLAITKNIVVILLSVSILNFSCFVLGATVVGPVFICLRTIFIVINTVLF